MNRILIAGIITLICSLSLFAQNTHPHAVKVDSLINNLDENSKKSLRQFYKNIFTMDSLAEEPLLSNMNRPISLEKKSVLSHALVYVSKSNILNELVHAYSQTSDTATQDMIVYTILGARYKFSQTSNLNLIPNKEIFPILIHTLSDTLDISSIAEGIKKINGIAWLAIQQWGEFKGLREIFARDFLGAPYDQKMNLQRTLLDWWKKNGNNVYWDKNIRMFTVAGKN